MTKQEKIFNAIIEAAGDLEDGETGLSKCLELYLFELGIVDEESNEIIRDKCMKLYFKNNGMY